MVVFCKLGRYQYSCYIMSAADYIGADQTARMRAVWSAAVLSAYNKHDKNSVSLLGLVF